MPAHNLEVAQLSRRSLLRASALFAGGTALAALPFGRMAFAHDVAENWPNVAALADKYVSQKKLANLFLTFGWGASEDHAHTVGGGTLALAKPMQVDENSLYRIYSMSKPITGMATMILIDEGKLGLDQPVHEILPAFRDMKVLIDPKGSLDDTVPANQPITIRMLLTHTAGLGYNITEGSLQQAYNEAGLVGAPLSKFPIPGVPTITPAPSLADFADRLAELPLMFQPATKWSYSCSLDLLGRVIEVASGMEFEAFLKKRIFDPCGMTSTWFQVPASEAGRLTDNYGIVGGNVFPLDPAAASIFLDAPSVKNGGGGLVSSPKDYDRFLRMLLGYGRLDGKFVMSEEAVRVGTSNLIPASVDLKGSWLEGEGHGAGGRSKGASFGWGGAAGTLGAVDFDIKLRSCLWTQYMPSEAYPIRDEFMAAMEKDLGMMRMKKKAA